MVGGGLHQAHAGPNLRMLDRHFVCMSNHYHLVVSDILGNLPAFEQYLNSLLARSVNCVRARWEAFWTRESYNASELLEDSDVLDKVRRLHWNDSRVGLFFGASCCSGYCSWVFFGFSGA